MAKPMNEGAGDARLVFSAHDTHHERCGAPPGYLLIKSRSRPDNVVRRCPALGFAVFSL